MQIDELRILGGVGKNNQPDLVEDISLKIGDVISIVGPTGSGKTTLIDDIALFANRNTPTNRSVLINGAPAPEEFMTDPSKNPIAFITQHTNFLSDLRSMNFWKFMQVSVVGTMLCQSLKRPLILLIN